MTPGFTQVAGSGQRGVAAVQKVLSVLDMLPADEPPVDLMVRTLRRLDAATAEGPGALRPP